jgi:hypothetical protein
MLIFKFMLRTNNFSNRKTAEKTRDGSRTPDKLPVNPHPIAVGVMRRGLLGSLTPPVRNYPGIRFGPPDDVEVDRNLRIIHPAGQSRQLLNQGGQLFRTLRANRRVSHFSAFSRRFIVEMQMSLR